MGLTIYSDHSFKSISLSGNVQPIELNDILHDIGTIQPGYHCDPVEMSTGLLVDENKAINGKKMCSHLLNYLVKRDEDFSTKSSFPFHVQPLHIAVKLNWCDQSNNSNGGRSCIQFWGLENWPCVSFRLHWFTPWPCSMWADHGSYVWEKGFFFMIIIMFFFLILIL